MAFYKQLAQRKGFFSKIPKYLYFWFYLRSKSKIVPFYPCLPYPYRNIKYLLTFELKKVNIKVNF